MLEIRRFGRCRKLDEVFNGFIILPERNESIPIFCLRLRTKLLQAGSADGRDRMSNHEFVMDKLRNQAIPKIRRNEPSYTSCALFVEFVEKLVLLPTTRGDH